MKNRKKKAAFAVAVVLLLIAVGVSVLQINSRTTTGNELRISSAGLHLMPKSYWVKSVEVQLSGEELIMSVTEETIFKRQGWDFIWNIFKPPNSTRRKCTMRFPKTKHWEIIVRNKERTVTCQTDSHRHIYDHSDPKHSILREESLDGSK